MYAINLTRKLEGDTLMDEKEKVVLAAAVVGGYVLGRTKKGRLALSVATYLAGRRFGLEPRQLAAEGMRRLGEIPQFAELQEQLRGEALEAGRKAVAAAADRGMSTLADAISDRTARLGETSDRHEEDEEDEEEEAPEEEEDEPEAEYEEEEEDGEEEEPEEKPQRRRSSSRGTRPEKASAPTPKKAAASRRSRQGEPAPRKSASASKTAAKKSAPAKNAQAKKTTSSKRAASKRADRRR
ncbi:histone protein [Streptomyces sp. NPDC057950]|uniref:histone protein n=1 Tax=Streptomyces sp. NPDC057950 TaxID=3346288 RepID=UPI0036EF18D6